MRHLRPAFALVAALAISLLALGSLAPAARAQAEDVQHGLERAARAGGVYSLPRGARVTVRNGVVVPAGVTLDLNGGELVALLDRPDTAAVRLLSGSSVRNGSVTAVSRGNPASQAGAHSAILVGALLGENAGPGRLSRFAAPSGWTISDVTVRADKRRGAAGIQVIGGAHDGLIERVRVPDSAVLSGAVMLDWGIVGPVSSGDVHGTARAYRRGAAYTTHPHDIVIRDIRIGSLSRPSRAADGSFGVRLSGVHDVSVSGISADFLTEAALFHTAGDLGYEFARAADRARAHRGIRVSGVRLARAAGHILHTDSHADNIGRAAANGYRPMLPPIAVTDMVVSDVAGSAVSGARYGLRVNHQKGGVFRDIEARGFRRGVYIDEQVYDLRVERPVLLDSVEAAVSVEHPHRPPERVVVSDPRTSGRAAGASVIIVGRSEGVSILGAGNASVRLSAQARAANIPGLRR